MDMIARHVLTYVNHGEHRVTENYFLNARGLLSGSIAFEEFAPWAS